MRSVRYSEPELKRIEEKNKSKREREREREKCTPISPVMPLRTARRGSLHTSSGRLHVGAVRSLASRYNIQYTDEHDTHDDEATNAVITGQSKCDRARFIGVRESGTRRRRR